MVAYKREIICMAPVITPRVPKPVVPSSSSQAVAPSGGPGFSGNTMVGAFLKLRQKLMGLNGYQAQDLKGGDTIHAQLPSWEEKQALLQAFKQTDLYTLQGGTALGSSLLDTMASWILENPKALGAMQAHGLSLAEAVAIAAYTHLGPDSRCTAINQGIREGDPSLQPFQRTLEQGLEKLPPHRGVVYRFAHLPPDVGDLYQVGHKPVTDPGVFSASQDPVFDGRRYLSIEDRLESLFQGEKAEEKKSYYFEVHLAQPSTKARDVSAFSRSHEACVLLPPGTSFEVRSRAENPTKIEATRYLGPDGGARGETIFVAIGEKRD